MSREDLVASRRITGFAQNAPWNIKILTQGGEENRVRYGGIGLTEGDKEEEKSITTRSDYQSIVEEDHKTIRNEGWQETQGEGGPTDHDSV